MDPNRIKYIVEACLLVAGRPMNIAQLEALFEGDDARPTRDGLRQAIAALQADYAERAIELVEVSSGWRLQSRTDVQHWVSRLFQERTPRYSRALLETLVLVAYRQPITRGEIEEVRGVAVSSNIVRTLQERQWVREVGYKDVPGKPALLGTTRQFLDYFNLKRLEDLPTLGELKDLDAFDAVLAETGLVAGAVDAPAANDSDDGEGGTPEAGAPGPAGPPSTGGADGVEAGDDADAPAGPAEGPRSGTEAGRADSGNGSEGEGEGEGTTGGGAEDDAGARADSHGHATGADEATPGPEAASAVDVATDGVANEALDPIGGVGVDLELGDGPESVDVTATEAGVPPADTPDASASTDDSDDSDSGVSDESSVEFVAGPTPEAPCRTPTRFLMNPDDLIEVPPDAFDPTAAESGNPPDAEADDVPADGTSDGMRGPTDGPVGSLSDDVASTVAEFPVPDEIGNAVGGAAGDATDGAGGETSADGAMRPPSAAGSHDGPYEDPQAALRRVIDRFAAEHRRDIEASPGPMRRDGVNATGGRAEPADRGIAAEPPDRNDRVP